MSLVLLKVGSYEILPAGLMKKLQRGNNFKFHLGGAQNWVFQVPILYTYARCQHDGDLLFVKPRKSDCILRNCRE